MRSDLSKEQENELVYRIVQKPIFDHIKIGSGL